MYTELFSFGAALIACVGMMLYGADAAVAGGGFFIAAVAVGIGVDAQRAKRRAACE